MIINWIWIGLVNYPSMSIPSIQYDLYFVFLCHDHEIHHAPTILVATTTTIICNFQHMFFLIFLIDLHHLFMHNKIAMKFINGKSCDIILFFYTTWSDFMVIDLNIFSICSSFSPCAVIFFAMVRVLAKYSSTYSLFFMPNTSNSRCKA